jgi:hypothetical protein
LIAISTTVAGKSARVCARPCRERDEMQTGFSFTWARDV